MDGLFLSYVTQSLLDASTKKYSKDQMLSAMTKVIDLYYSCESSDFESSENIDAQSNALINHCLKSASPEELKRLSVLLPWSASSKCSHFILGGRYNSNKRVSVASIPDATVNKLHQIIDFNQKVVIESGCFEAIHSVSMAMLGAKVYGFDVRIENVLKSMIRAWAYGQSAATCFDLLNIEDTSVSDFYSAAYPNLDIDVFHCRGVLYHLRKPYIYCSQIAALNPTFIYFHTQVASDDQADELIETPHGAYNFFNYKEKGRVAPFAGVEDCAKWFTVSSLKSFMAELGFGQVVFERLKEERNGLRFEVLLTR